MFNYTCLNPIAGVGLDLFSDDYKKVDDIKDADAALVRSAAMHDMELGDKVLAVARAGAGVNNIPLDKCAEQGIVVFNTPGANANGVKELVFAGMLYASRDIVGGIDWCLANQNDENIAKTAEKQKKNFAGTEISGKKLGVIGLGAIGVLVANAAVHMGMDVYGYDPYISVNAAWNLSRSVKHISNVEDIYKNCDVITIHVPLLDSTKKMINADAIAMMKPTAIVLNFARDLLVDEEAMVDALAKGKVKMYVSDQNIMVFDGSQKPKLKQTIKLEKLIDSVFYNNKYIGVAYSNNDKNCTSHIKLYDFNGKMLMENDTAIAYNSIEFDSNNEVCVTGDTACEIYTIHGVKKFYHTFDNKLYKVMYKSGMNNYIFIYDGAMDEVRLK